LPGGAAVGSGVSLPSLARALEAIRRLVAIGALDGALIGGIGSLGGGPSIALPELQRPTSLSVQSGPGSGSSGPPSTPAARGEGVGSILKDATPGKVSKPGMGSTQYSKSGGFQRANADFDSLAGSSQIKRYPGDIRSTTLPDGTKVSVRPGSSQGDPTLQIEIPGQNPIKVRYGQ
jgi:hypothetical protein